MTKQIIHSPSQGLAVRSAKLVTRGLRDLARQSNWLTKKLFDGTASQAAVSSTAQVCAIGPVTPNEISLYDVETVRLIETLEAPEPLFTRGADRRTMFAWSPTARYLVAASTAWKPELHIFDCHTNALLGAFGDFAGLPAKLAWSNNEKYFAMATADPKRQAMRLWQASKNPGLFAGKAVRTTAASDAMERQTYEAEFGDEGSFSGYGCTAFSADNNSIATVMEIKGDWADDSILLMNVPSLEKRNLYSVRGHVTHLTWQPDGAQIIYCAAGQAYRLTLSTSSVEELPFGAEMCVHHPELPVCLCFSSWVKGAAQGRVFLADMNRLTIYDEHEAEGIVDLRWSLDGMKAFGVTHSGLAYIYEPALP